MNDTTNLPFPTLKRLYDLSNATTRDKIVDMKIEFWTDESQLDAICTYTFRGWISAFHNTGGGGSNHTLTMTFTPELDPPAIRQARNGQLGPGGRLAPEILV